MTLRGEKIKALLISGHGQRNIIRETGASKSTISYHRKLLGLSKPPNRVDWSAIQIDLDHGLTERQIAKKHKISTQTIWLGGKLGKVAAPPRSRLAQASLAELLDSVEGMETTPYQRRLIRKRIEEAGMVGCRQCGVSTWQGQALLLEVHHNDGNPRNNSLDNISLLCPNCHSLTPNWKGRNAKKGFRRPRDQTLSSAVEQLPLNQ